jgi:nitroimidazol reductase NimA-like FMN-containing flavoprotein (pyridoxamine 5'-phosphate oxidase superfamily)
MPNENTMRRKDREINDIREIENIINEADVCRIALAAENIPYIVTLNFGYSGGNEPEIFFHCAGEGKKLDMIRKNNHVCFEFDTDHMLYGGEKGCDWGMKYRSVVGYGYVSVIRDNAEKVKAFNIIMDHYAPGKEFTYDPASIDKALILKLKISGMTGKKTEF